MANIEYKKVSELYFDRQNPRLVEYTDIKKKSTTEDDILNKLWSEMAVSEIVMSILAHGFFENEAMYAVMENGKYIIVEGNRRLAAVKAIISPEKVRNNGMARFIPKISEKLIDDLKISLPVIVLKNREDAWRYIGFKHVNGAAKWDSYAKAEYIASVHNNFGISLDDIAEQIGDENRLVVKFYQSLMVLRQANEMTRFKTEDAFAGRIYFSHLYTAMGYPEYRNFIGLSLESQEENPIPQSKIPNLEELMFWMFGSRKESIEPVVHSQNPDLRNLSQVLGNKEALAALRVSANLETAFDLSQDGKNVLYDSLAKAKLDLTKASSKLSYYDGDEDTLKLSGSVANMADELYDNIERVNLKMKGVPSKKRISE